MFNWRVSSKYLVGARIMRLFFQCVLALCLWQVSLEAKANINAWVTMGSVTGDFRINWSNSDGYVYLYDSSSPSPIYGQSGLSGYRDITGKPIGTYTYRVQNNIMGGRGPQATDYVMLTVVVGFATPTITAISNVAINEDTSTAAIPFTIADADTPISSLSVTATSSNTALVPSVPIVGTGASRTLTVTPVANGFGSTTVTVIVSDGGRSSSTSFVVTVNPVNDLPTISGIGSVNLSEAASGVSLSTGTLNFTVGDVETAAGNLTVAAISSNTALIPNGNITTVNNGSSRTISAAVAARRVGSSLITVTVSDGVASASTTFWVTVADRPATFTSVPATSTDGKYTLWWDYAKDNVRILERFNNGTWVDLGDNAPAGSLARNQTQTGTYDYQLKDCYHDAMGSPVCNVTDSKTTVVTLPAPTVNAILSPTTISEGGTATLTWTSTNATSCSSSVLGSVSGTSNTTGVTYAAPTVMSADQTVTIPIHCTGGGGSVDVNPSVLVKWVNDLPTISGIANFAINEDTSSGAMGFSVSDEETAATSLSFKVDSSNPALIPNTNVSIGGTGTNHTVVVTPLANANGSATITLTVTDGNGGQASTNFVVTVNAVNDVPTISGIANVNVSEGTASTPASTGILNFTVGDVETAAGNLTVAAISSNTALIPNGNITTVNNGSSRTVNASVVVGQVGSSLITVTVSDGVATASTSFTVTVNDLPATFTSVPSTSSDGQYTLWWAYAKDNVRILERFNNGTWVDLGDNARAGSLARSQTQSGTYDYQLKDCYHDAMGSPVCNVTDTKTTVVTFPVPAAPALDTTTQNSPDGSVTLNWGSTVKGVANYAVYENGGTTAVWQGLASGTTLTGRSTGSYSYVVKAWNSQGWSAPSAAKQVNVANPSVATFSEVKLNPKTGVVTVNGSAVGATSYEIQQSANSGATWVTVATPNSLPTDLPALNAEGTYRYQMRACATINSFKNCTGFVAYNGSLSLAKPASPTLTLAANSSQETFNLSWLPVDNAQNYNLEETLAGSSAATVTNFTTLSASRTTPNGTHKYRIQGCNAAGCGAWSTYSQIDVAALGTQATPSVTMDAKTGVPTFTITPPSGTTGYKIQAKKNGIPTGSEKTFTSLSAPVMPAATLEGNYSYTVKACATVNSFTNCNAGVDTNSVSISKPLAPTALTLNTMSTTGTYTLTWSPVSNASSYVVLLEGVSVDTPTGTSYSPPTAKPNGTYNYSVQSCNAVGCGSASTVSSIDVVIAPAPASVKATLDQMTGALSAQWADVANSLRYEVQVKRDGADLGPLTPVNALQTSLPAVKEGGSYAVAVRACLQIRASTNCSGWTISNTVKPEVPATPMVDSPLTSGTGNFGVSWSRVIGATHYQLYENDLLIQDSNQWSKVFNGFNAKGTGSYRYQVKACKIACSALSNISTTTVALAGNAPAPSIPSTAPIALSAELTDGYVNSPAPLEAPTDTPVGTLAGQFRVNESGAATYTVEIAMADGVAGVKPPLSIGYNSQGGNGPLGMGWSLSGFGDISRCRQTLATDGRALPLLWDNNDRFCLNGQRLVVVSGAYGQVGSTYKTEIDSFVLVTAQGGTLGNPDYFTVEAKDGSTTTYGGSGNDISEVTIPSRGTLTWGIRRVEDNMGNPIVYQYAGALIDHRVTEIDYAYGASKNEANYGARVVFDYEAGRPDETVSYIGGAELRTSLRMSKIRTYNRAQNTETLVRRYNFAYSTDYTYAPDKPYFYTTNLQSIKECSSETGDAQCFKPTSFKWMGTAYGFLNYGPTQTLGKKVIDRTYLDINGNGLSDLIYTEYDDGSHRYTTKFILDFNSSSATQPANLFNFDFVNFSGLPRIIPIDYNADGHTDLLFYDPDQEKWTLLLSGFSDKGWRLGVRIDINLAGFESDNVQVGDINSDGLADIIVRTKNGVSVYPLVKKANVDPTSPLPYQIGTPTTSTLVPNPYPDTTSSSVRGIGDPALPALWDEMDKIDATTDFNGDGQVDLVITIAHKEDRGPLGHATVFTTTQVFLGSGDGHFVASTVLGDDIKQVRVADINADGLVDLGYKTAGHWVYQLNTGAGFSPQRNLYSSGTNNITDDSLYFADANHDGYLDVIWQQPEFMNTGTVYENGRPLYAKYWTGKTGDFSQSDKLDPLTIKGDFVDLVDTNSDSYPDEVRIGADANDKWYVVVKMANDVRNLDPATGALKPPQIMAITDGLGNVTNVNYEPISRSSHYLPLGNIKEVGYQAYDCSAISSITHQAPTNLDDCKVVDRTTFDTSNYYRQLNAPFAGLSNPYLTDAPVLEAAGPLFVVTHVDSSAPIVSDVNATASLDYFYQHLRMQAAGRGMLGFELLSVQDNQTGTVTDSRYRQDWPFMGSPKDTTVTVNTSKGKGVIKRATNTWAVNSLTGADSTRIVQPYMKRSDESVYALNSDETVSTTALQTITTDNVMATGTYGNIASTTVTTQGGGDSFVKTTTNTYSPDDWEARMGRLISTTVANTRNNLADGSRTVSFSYYPQASAFKGLLKQEVVEQGTFNELVTDYVYDSFGNKTQVKVKGYINATDRETRTSTTAYDAEGRYVVSTTNDLSQTSNITARDPATGQASTVSDINGVTAQVLYGAFGKEYLRQDATGAWQRTDTQYCDANSTCPTGAAFFTRTRVAGGGEAYQYADKNGHVVRERKRGFDGSWINVDNEYDIQGRLVRQSTPYFEGSTPDSWTQTTYDALSRPTKVIAPNQTETTQAYNGTNTVMTNALKQSRIEIHNGLGQLVQVMEPAFMTRVEYRYNVKGDLIAAATTSMMDGKSATIRMCYDTLGRKIAMLDPDKGGWLAGSANSAPLDADVCSGLSPTASGWWHYNYNAFGELIGQTDAKGQTTTMVYDQLGRLIKRYDDVQTRWFYDKNLDGSSPAGTQGKLTALVVRPNGDAITECLPSDHCTQYFYDQFARPTDTLLMLPNDSTGYVSSTKYDSIGRAYEQRDALNGTVFGNSGIQTQFNEYGYAYRTIDIAPVNGGNSVLSRITSMNARGQVTSEIRGNGAITTNSYNALTGLLEHQYATNALGFAIIQDEAYDWDVIGNLKSRTNRNANVGSTVTKNLTESFCYDGLNRLTQSIKNNSGVCNNPDLTYDGLGNITYKRDVGNYTYSSNNAGPHAVTQAGSASYTYDANGNNTSGDGRNLTYTSYDKLLTVTKNGITASFQYDGNRNAWQKNLTGANGAITTYLGNVERIQKGYEIEWKRNVGGAVFTYKTNLNNQLLQNGASAAYLYVDHLGSIDVITDAVGKVTNSMSFDAWGARRDGETWGALTDAQRIEALKIGTTNFFSQPITTHGFTGHDMLDEMGIVNMGGRIYDAKLGRFLQADIYIDGVKDTQGYNRYSYVHNNPLNATDPSGFSSLRQFVGLIVAAVLTIFAPEGAGLWWNMFVGAMAGGAQAAANGQNVLKGAFFGAFTAAAGGGGGWQGILASATAGGIASYMQGGKFGTGFVSAGVGAMVGQSGLSGWKGFVVSSVAGGTVSELTGDKFGNGAMSSAISYLVMKGAETIREGGGHDLEVTTKHADERLIRISKSRDGSVDAENLQWAKEKAMDYFINNSDAIPNGMSELPEFEYKHIDDPTSIAKHAIAWQKNPYTGEIIGTTAKGGVIEVYMGGATTKEQALLIVLHEYGHHNRDLLMDWKAAGNNMNKKLIIEDRVDAWGKTRFNDMKKRGLLDGI